MSDVVLLTSVVEHEAEPSETDGISFRRVSISGEPFAAATVGAAIQHYHGVTGRRKPDQAQLDTLVGIKVTLIQFGTNMLGSTFIVAREGRIFEGQRGLAILPKGKRSKGYSINVDSVLDVLPGWDSAGAQMLMEAVTAKMPTLRNLTQERLNELPGEDQGDSMLTLALFGNNPVFGAPDCLWLIGEYWPEDDICDMSVLLIRPEFGISEHGSSFGRDHLRNRAIGEVVDFEPISFRDAIALCNVPHDEALARVLG